MVFVRKAALLNISAVLGVGKDSRHGIQIISGQARRSLSEADRVFHIVDAIDAAEEEQLQNIDVVRFVSLLQDVTAQLILGTAFASSAGSIIRQAAEQYIAHLIAVLIESPAHALLPPDLSLT